MVAIMIKNTKHIFFSFALKTHSEIFFEVSQQLFITVLFYVTTGFQFGEMKRFQRQIISFMQFIMEAKLLTFHFMGHIYFGNRRKQPAVCVTASVSLPDSQKEIITILREMHMVAVSIFVQLYP